MYRYICAEFATCMCRDGKGRVGYVSSWLCAEFAMCRVDPVLGRCRVVQYDSRIG